MGPSWIRVARDAIVADEQLSSWIDAAMDDDARAGASGR
ncbi:hypothetical protein SAMN06893096_103252 [Geodermatophilus pulveris]|uniref:Uncharacterized protein n=1 Tax=Geodermatophilus pulveris TaxID=1564159 RepID=A0A239DM29_9ACTN|nr:hypothetical protein SAMN06893096_103252 [Geodermatophilus pulveris]